MSKPAPQPRGKKPHRRWLQFSLATLLVAFTVLGVGLGLWVNSARRQERAVQALKAAGGHATYDYVFDAHGKPKPAELQRPSGPEWLQQWLGVDYLHHVVDIALGDPRAPDKVNDDALRHVECFPKVKSVFIFHTAITGEGLSHLKGLTRLKTLYIYDTPLRDEGLIHLADLQSLEELYLLDTRITDAGLVHLHGMQNLKSLHINVVRVTSLDSMTSSAIEALKKALPNCKVD